MTTLHTAGPATSSSRRRRTADRRRNSAVPPLRGLVLLVVGLGIWQLAADPTSPYAPPPSQWWDELRHMWEGGVLGDAAVATAKTFVLALVAASILGVILGAAVGRVHLLDRLIGPFLEYCRVMPPAAVIPLAVLTLGYTERMKTIVVVFAAMWPILLQVRAGARSLDPVLLDTGRALHLGRMGSIRKILAPWLIPSILTGIRLATPTVLIIVILVEIITRVDGVGGLIAESQQSFNSAAVFGLLALTALLALVVNSVVSLLEDYLLRYRPRP
jgi:ABC-type nitrate/sulfonate/bicarbonate transport system permease component